MCRVVAERDPFADVRSATGAAQSLNSPSISRLSRTIFAVRTRELVDLAPHAIRARLDVTYPSPRDPETILSAAVTIAGLIDDALAERAVGIRMS